MKYYDPRYDTTFKKVFHHPDLLISFLNALLPLEGDKQVESIEYLTPEMLPAVPDGKFSIVDVNCKDRLGRQFIVEMQMVWSEEFKTRVLFNASKAYVNQLEKGQEYKLLRPVYSLNLVNGIFEKDLPEDEYYHYYQLVHERHSDKVIEGLHILFIELPKFNPEDWVDKKMKRLWLRFLTEINPSTREAPAELVTDPVISKAVSLMEESAMTDTERYLYEKNLDNIRVEKSIVGEAWEKGEAAGMAAGMAKGMAQGMAQGVAQGMAQGMAQGKAEGILQVARNMKVAGMPIETISGMTGLAIEEIEPL